MKPQASTTDTITIHLPFRLVKRGGRKEVRLPEGVEQPRQPDSTLIKALARAFRWKRMLDNGQIATLAELAKRENISPSYLTRVLRLTLLAPGIIEEILDGRCGSDLTAERLRSGFGDDWAEQRRSLSVLE